VLNKADNTDRGQMAGLLSRYPQALPISARTRHGLPQLAAAASQALSHNFLDIDVETGVENGRLLAALSARGEVLSRRYIDNRVIVHCRIPQRALPHLHSPDTTIRPHQRGGVLPASWQPHGNGAIPSDGSYGPGDAPNGNGHAETSN
jgi:GTP-binding protein HflX